MLIDKNELSKITIANKILLNCCTEEEIDDLKATIVIDPRITYISLNSNVCKIQLSMKVQNIKSTTKCVVLFKDLVELAKTFTKKATIEIETFTDKIVFKGLQDKEEKQLEINMIEENPLAKINPDNTSSIDASDLLNGLNLVNKIIRDVPQINSETLVCFEEVYHKISFSTYTDIELAHYSYITDNEKRSVKLFFNKENIKFLVEIIKNLKSLEVKFGLNNKGYIVSANDIDVLVHVKNKNYELEISNLIDKIEQNSIFMPLKIKDIAIDNANQKDYLYIVRSEDGFIITNQIPSKYPCCYSYRLNKVISKNEIDVIYYDKKRSILKVELDGAKYYLMPKKNEDN